MLGFDVPTFIFQIVNFLILLAVLARFFYRPVLGLMRERQERIDALIEDAESKAHLADEERQKLAQQSKESGRQASAVLEEARNDAARERQRLIDEAKHEATAILYEAHKTAAADEKAAWNRLGTRLSESAVHIAGSLIRGSSGEAVHAGLVEKLTTDGFGLDSESGEQARIDYQGDSQKLIVETAYPLNAAQEEALRREAGIFLSKDLNDVHLEVREDPALIAGVRVVAGAVVIDMTIRHLLEELSRKESGL